MLGKRVIVALMIVMLLMGCGSDPTRDDGSSSPHTTQTSGAGPDGGDSTASSNASSGGGGGFNGFNGDPRAALAILAIVVVIGVVVITWDAISHTSSHLEGTVRHGIYRQKWGLFSVAVPDDTSAREPEEIGRQGVVFLPKKNVDPLYGVSVQPLLSADETAMSLDEFASKLYPAPASNDPGAHGDPLQAVLNEKLTLDGKPALFREYVQVPSLGAEPVYYLLYFVKDGDRAALVSINWTKDCSKCATGPESDIRAMDPELKKFVESFHLADPMQTH